MINIGPHHTYNYKQLFHHSPMQYLWRTMTSRCLAAVSTSKEPPICQQSILEEGEEDEQSFVFVEMDSNFRSMTLSRTVVRTKPLGKNSAVSGSIDSGIENEYTHVYMHSIGLSPCVWIKIKYPVEVDDAAPNGMLSSTDFDEIMERIRQVCCENIIINF